jgi:hypothetical protein
LRWQLDGDSGTGRVPGPRPARAAPDPSGFAADGPWDSCPPSAALAAALEAATGADRHCPGASPEELLGLVRQWQALEAWSAAGKLAVLRALIREDDQPLPGGRYRDDLPEGWSKSLTHEVALALSMPAVSAERLMWLAWDLQARFPGIGSLLAAGDVTLAKAKAVCEPLQLLSDEDAARAEAVIVSELPGQTYGQAQKLAVQAAVTVDPESAIRRRQEAERSRSRVQMFREESGAAALSGRDMPTDQTLAAHASVCARAVRYQASGLFPEETRMDQFRVMAYLDLLNGVSADARMASARCEAGAPSGGQAPPEEGFDEPGPGGSGPGGSGPGGSGPGGRTDRDEPDAEPPHRPADLILPLATLLGLAERPGAGHGLGPLDPALCRDLAAAAAGDPATLLCVTVTGPGGIAIGHGCVRTPAASSRRAALALPARVNLTMTAEHLSGLAGAGTGPPGRSGWSLIRTGDPGPPGGYGRWELTLPSGIKRILDLEPIATLDCDHRHESHGYQPNDALRHLVQVRDYTCTFPTCSRHARESDFEHAVPYHLGGRTCTCNAGARSRQCHRVKQSPGWNVTQPAPGWHQWTTPGGRTYTQGPYRYPV